MTGEPVDRHTIQVYLEAAHEALESSQYNLDGGFYGVAVNRAYYAVFYAASALLLTKGLSRSKHIGAISAFRQFFVRTELIEPEFSEIYGSLMDDRHVSDYEMDSTVEPERVVTDVRDARRFVERIETYLKHQGWV